MIRLFFILSIFLVSITPSIAVDLTDSLQLHGFASQGAIYSKTNNFITKDSSDGSTRFRDLGLNLNWSPFDRIRIGGQLYIREYGDYSGNDLQIDWALIDIQAWDPLSVKVGKIKLPFGLYNEQRDTSFLNPMIFLPQSIYDESRRDIYLAYVGLGLYGNISLKQFGDLDYHLFYGITDFPNESIQTYKSEIGAIAAIERNNALPDNRKNPLIPDTFKSIERESDPLYGISLIYTFPNIDLRLGASWLTSKSKIHINGESDPVGSNTVKSHVVLSLEYQWQDLMITSEYAEKNRKSEMFGNVSIDGPSQSWYMMLNYTLFDDWTISALYDIFYRIKYDKDGSENTKSAGHSAWRKDYSLGLKYDVNDYITVKAEYHWVDGTAMQMSVYNPEGAERYWEYVVSQISVNF